MGEFAFVFRGRDRTGPREQQQKTVERWRAWMKELAEKGLIVKDSQPFENSGRVVRGRHREIHDAPFAEVKDVINGFIVVAAEDINEAVQISLGCPIFDEDGSVEVRPVLRRDT